ncbi:MAG: MFS transporter [Deltaproteobacteria bacterium]|nr:MFS transporter [Deltaproteobacteria bacterium]
MNETLPSSSHAKDINPPKFFYGYIIVLCSFFIMLLTFGINYSFGVFFKPLVAEFGWSRGGISGAYSLNSIIAGFLGIFAGRLADRFGPKIVGITVGCALGCGFILLSMTRDLWYFYTIYCLILSIGIGAPWPCLIPTIARWFRARRGLMIGTVASGIGCGTFVVPPLAVRLISLYNWRVAYIVIGVITIILGVFVSQFLKKDPSMVGQKPYGFDDSDKKKSTQENEGTSFGEAVPTASFALFSIVYFCYGYCLHTIMVHIIPHATDVGIPRAQAAAILALIGGTSIVSRVLVAAASDRVGVKPALTVVFCVLLFSFLWIQIADTMWMLILFGIFFGISYGGAMSLQALGLAEVFGLKAMGTILGAITFMYTIGAAVGPMITGYIFDVTGRYSIAFWLATCLAILCLVFTWRLHFPSSHKAKGLNILQRQ